MILMICATTIVMNVSSEPWDDHDQKNLDAAEIRCEEQYKDAPCLLKFKKIESLVYYAICGKKVRDNEDLSETPEISWEEAAEKYLRHVSNDLHKVGRCYQEADTPSYESDAGQD